MCEEDEFYDRLLQCGGKGRQLSDPFLSPAQRSLLVEKDSSQSSNDNFHRRLAEHRADDSILRRSRGEDDPPVRELFVCMRRELFDDESIIKELLRKSEEQTYLERRSKERSMFPDVDIFDDSHGFWRLDHHSPKEAGEFSVLLPSLEKGGVHAVDKRKSSEAIPLSMPSKYRGLSSYFFSRRQKNLTFEKRNAEPCDISFRIDPSLVSYLTHLSLRGGSLELVQSSLAHLLPALKSLNLSHSNLRNETLPSRWNLPKLTRLDLSHNCLTVFPNICIFEGTPLLQTLNLYGNKISEVRIPTGTEHILKNLRTLDLGFNNLAFLHEDLACLPALRTLRVPNNCLGRIPARICGMKCLKSIDVACNPVTEPPIETCERGLKSMKRYWLCLADEASSVASTDFPGLT